VAPFNAKASGAANCTTRRNDLNAPARKSHGANPQGEETMRICIPVNEDQGLQSEVCAHFGSAPAFLIVDTDSGDCRAIINRNQQHSHGMCTPLASLQGEILDGIVVGGIGMGALNKLMAAGISVFRAAHPTVMATIDSFKAGTLAPMQPGMACGGHGHGHG
jgi:predicted Fe-Mo cluster-binding NifX family protein